MTNLHQGQEFARVALKLGLGITASLVRLDAVVRTAPRLPHALVTG
jgi:hypothetical protein